MVQEGQIALLSLPQTNYTASKLRPVLILRSLPGQHGDWLVCMISTKLHQEMPETDEVVRATDSDFSQTGLKVSSLIRATRLAVVSADILHGAIGKLTPSRLDRIRLRLAQWIAANG